MTEELREATDDHGHELLIVDPVLRMPLVASAVDGNSNSITILDPRQPLAELGEATQRDTE